MSFCCRIGYFASLLFTCFVWITPLSAASSDDETITVTRDKDKTVYTIGSGKQQEDPEKEKAWEMLKDLNIWTRENDGKRPDTGR
jgi:hypothetical protein